MDNWPYKRACKGPKLSAVLSCCILKGRQLFQCISWNSLKSVWALSWRWQTKYTLKLPSLPHSLHQIYWDNRRENYINYHPHSDVLKQGRETCTDQNWICLSKMKEAGCSPLEGPQMPLTTKSRDTGRVTGEEHQQAHSRTGTRYSVPGESGHGGKGEVPPKSPVSTAGHPGPTPGHSGTNPCHKAGAFLKHLNGLAGEPALPRRSLRQTNILKGRW